MGEEERYYGADKIGTETKFAADALKAFADSFLGGELKPHKREDLSAPPPSDDDDEGEGEGEADEADVVVLSSDSFDEVVRDGTKDVLVEFYAPWCGHCKALAPEYAAAATRLAEHEHVVLAKMDTTENEPPAGFDVSGYPTLLFVGAKEGAKPVPYDGEREADAIVAWVEANALSLK